MASADKKGYGKHAMTGLFVLLKIPAPALAETKFLSLIFILLVFVSTSKPAFSTEPRSGVYPNGTEISVEVV